MHSIIRNNLAILTQKPVYRDSPSGNIKFDSNSFDCSAFAFDDVAFNVTNNLRIERGGFLTC